jgi:hypothetical protein
MVFWVWDSIVELNDIVEWEWGNQGIVCIAGGYTFINRNDNERVFLWTT